MFTYGLYDVLTREDYGQIDLTDVSFNEPVSGPGQFTGTYAVNTATNYQRTKLILESGRAAIYVFEGSDIIWPGLVTEAPWNPHDQTVQIQAVEAESWLDDRLHGVTQGIKIWNDTEQFQIARELIQYATSVTGAPPITVLPGISGIQRDLTIQGQSFTPVSELINSMAKREDGFHWKIRARKAQRDGLPEWYLWMQHPERQAKGDTKIILFLHDSPGGGNIISRGDWPTDLSNRKNKIYALGEGEVPNQMIAIDSDPLLESGAVLLREKSTSYLGRGIVDVNTLAGHAKAERVARADTVGTLTVDTLATNPKISDYYVGDRVRLVLKDAWLDIDLPEVRIIDRTVRAEDRQAVAQVSLTLDLNDAELPEE